MRCHNGLQLAGSTLEPHPDVAAWPPSLRNVAATAPYMHDGRLETLAEVVDFYAAGTLSDGKRRDLISFLSALTDVAASKP